ncbi:GroES-like protein [Metschnikowia bicuspidata var. bicuspidata NRRL YB-4993]|uniref:GroES-like protein n=1 Tax=Metschnikowia bicuspidata var. bicuspidata NRRL YB-4993 TaxID=869754 RepID=A0A1A0H601_9ASCO|nr:GroES-like protein [Metschnikowia bicuspidata var. bicuspidata NRRL YB-4993]OBA19514.1 GroES-like protein [Metschnikowia bicuspidata var. bicuspidata NRRL YB-4993]
MVIENKALAVNPIDWIISLRGFLVQEFPVILGLDCAGVVVSVGLEAAASFSVGDRVLALTESIFSPLQDKGGFQKYSAVRTLTASRLPQNTTFVEGSTFPLAALTAAIGLFHKDHLALDLPQTPAAPHNGKTVLVWGGASSVGANAIQMTVAAGYCVVTTASASDFELVRRAGATHVFDYRKPSVVGSVLAVLGGTDFVGTFVAAAKGVSFRHASKITAAAPGVRHMVSAPLYPLGFESDVTSTWTDLGVANYLAETRRLATHVFHDFLPRALATRAISVTPAPRVLGRGLDKLQAALDIMAEGVSAEKLVVEM